MSEYEKLLKLLDLQNARGQLAKGFVADDTVVSDWKKQSPVYMQSSRENRRRERGPKRRKTDANTKGTT